MMKQRDGSHASFFGRGRTVQLLFYGGSIYMSRIDVSPDLLDQVARHFKRASEDSRMINARLKQKINQIESQWQGASQKDFYMKFRHSQKVMENFTSTLATISLDLEKIANRFRDADIDIDVPVFVPPSDSQIPVIMPDVKTMAIPEEGPVSFEGPLNSLEGDYNDRLTTLAIGEEGNDSIVRTMAISEEGSTIIGENPTNLPDGNVEDIATTLALGEEGDRPVRTQAIGEETN